MTKFYHTKLKRAFIVKSIVTVLYFDYSKQFRFAGESHDFWEILYVDKGEITVRSDSTNHKIKSGDMIFHKPHEFHDITSTGIASSAVIISFSCESESMQSFEKKIFKTTQKEKDLISSIIKDSMICFKPLTDKPPVYGMQRKINSPLIEQCILNSLELLLLNILRREKQIPEKFGTTNSNSNLNEITEYLKANLNRNLNLKIIADELCMSVSKLKKSFEKNNKGGLINYLIELKIERAKELIKEEEYNLTEISEMLGFNSIHYFSRRFKKVTGKSPTEYLNSVL